MSKYFGAAAIVILSAASCAHPVAVTRGFPKNAASAGYTTYFLLQGTSSGNAGTDTQLVSDVEIALAGKGWVEVAPQDAQAIIVTHVVTKAKHSVEVFYDGWADWTWRFTKADSRNRGGQYSAGTVVVDAFDARTRHVFWRASASGIVALDGRRAAGESDRRLDRLARAMPDSDPRMGRDTDERGPTTAIGTIVIFAQVPVALVLIDGPPSYTPVPDSALERVANTPSFMIRDGAGMHYLRIASGWMEADTVEGPWTIAGTVPPAAEEAFQRMRAKSRVLPEMTYGAPRDEAGTAAAGDVPMVVVSTRPVRLVGTDGQLRFDVLKGTSILYARNATAPLFKEPTDGELYVCLDDEWYRAWTLDGPWQKISDEKLPADLTRIPATVLQIIPRVKH
jgi:hypothetical protein